MALSAPASKRRCNPYVYEKLCDLRSGSSGINIMGIVTLFKPPYKSKGTDFTCTVEIVDEGCASSPFPLIFFNRDVNKLPRSCSVGNVLCVRRVDVSEFNQRLQGKCRHFCSWLVWGGGKGEGPSRTSEGTTWDPDEKNRADQLIRWSTSLVPQASGSHQPTPITQSPPTTTTQPPLTTTLKPIADIGLTDKKINFVGVIKTVSTPQKSKGPDYFVSVTLIDETSSTEGLTFTFFNPREDQLPKMGDPGSIAFLRNMSISDYQGSLLGRGHQRSKAVCFSLQPDGELTATAGSDSEVPVAVRDRAKALLEWVASAELQLGALEDSEMDSQPCAPHPLPPPGDRSVSSKQSDPDLDFIPPTFLTLVLHPTWKINSLSDIQTYPKVPSCFRVRVKVLQVLQQLEDCCQLRCSQCKYKFAPTKKVSAACAHCKREGKSGSLRYMFFLSLLVRDATTSVTVHLSDTDADEFFQDLPAAYLHDNPSTRESLQKILNSLTGGHDPFLPIQVSPLSDKRWPWIDCCLQTYSSCKGTQFRIMDTWFVTRE